MVLCSPCHPIYLRVTLYCPLYSHTALPKIQIFHISAPLTTLEWLPIIFRIQPKLFDKAYESPTWPALAYLSSVTSCHCLIYSFIQWTWIECVLCARHYYRWATAVNTMDLSFPGVGAILIYPLFPFTSGPICIKCILLRKLIVLISKSLPLPVLPCLANFYSSCRSSLLSRLG